MAIGDPATPTVSKKKRAQKKLAIAAAGLPPEKPGDPKTIPELQALFNDKALPPNTKKHAQIRATLLRLLTLIKGFADIFAADAGNAEAQRDKAALAEKGVTEKTVLEIGRMGMALLASVTNRNAKTVELAAAVMAMLSFEKGASELHGKTVDTLRATYGRKSDKLADYGAKMVSGGAHAKKKKA